MMEAPAIDLEPPPGAPGPSPPTECFAQQDTSFPGSGVVYPDARIHVEENVRTTAPWATTATPSPWQAQQDVPDAADSTRSERGGSPLGWWSALGVHQRAFGRRSSSRLLSAFQLLTPSWRVAESHSVAILVARDRVSLMTWLLLAALTTVAFSWVLASVLLGSIFVILALPVLVVAAMIVAAALGQRVNAWKTAGVHRDALVVSDVAADPRGHGHGTALMTTIANFADGVGRELVLSVDPANVAAVRLYRSCGFVAEDQISGRRARMVRSAPVDAANQEPLPSWLVPIRCGAWTAVGAAVVTAALVALYWSTPAAWLMAPFVMVAAIAADSDARTLRIPNRLVALGASLVALTAAVTASAFDAAIIWPSIAGGAIFAVPLFVSHVLSRGRSGLGDVKLAAVFGLVAGAVDPNVAFGALIVAMLLGSVFGLFWRRRHQGGFPLAPALTVGTTLVLALWAVLEGPTTW